jgi:hypothetical protein
VALHLTEWPRGIEDRETAFNLLRRAEIRVTNDESGEHVYLSKGIEQIIVEAAESMQMLRKCPVICRNCPVLGFSLGYVAASELGGQGEQSSTPLVQPFPIAADGRVIGGSRGCGACPVDAFALCRQF